MRFIAVMGLLLFLFSFRAEDKDFVWRNVTSPYRNYIFPGRSGLRYTINYNYPQESNSLRRYLKSKYDVKNSASIAKIFKDVSSGVFFDRYFDAKFKYLEAADTIIITLQYANGETATQKHAGIKGNRRFSIPLTNDKYHHDFALGTAHNGHKGLVTMVDVFIKRQHRDKNHVVILTKLVTEADLPGIVSKIRGNRLLK